MPPLSWSVAIATIHTTVWLHRLVEHDYAILFLVELSRVGRSPSSSAHWLPAQHVDQADIQFGSLVDRGAYGEVFRGVWQGNDVAVKVFSAGLLTSDGLASFQREVFVMNCLRHPNVVLLLGACQTPPKLSIIMEYVAGGSLHKASHLLDWYIVFIWAANRIVSRPGYDWSSCRRRFCESGKRGEGLDGDPLPHFLHLFSSSFI